MEQQTIQQQIDYWLRYMPIGSVWFSPQLIFRYVTIQGMSYDNNIGVVMVHYTGKDSPGKVYQEKAGAFYNYFIERRVQ